jgi:Domain of unknown function (DUF4352)
VTHTSLRPASPEAPATARRRRRRWPWLAAGVLAAVAIGSGAYAMAAGGKHQAPASSVRSAADAGFAFTVGAVRCGDRTVGPADLAQTTTGQFCLIDVTVRNSGPEPALLDPGAQQAIDAHGTKYPISDRAAVFLNDGSPTLLEQIPAGAVVSGVLPFEMPAGPPPVALELHESVGSPGVRVPLA